MSSWMIAGILLYVIGIGFVAACVFGRFLENNRRAFPGFWHIFEARAPSCKETEHENGYQ